MAAVQWVESSHCNLFGRWSRTVSVVAVSHSFVSRAEGRGVQGKHSVVERKPGCIPGMVPEHPSGSAQPRDGDSPGVLQHLQQGAVGRHPVQF